MISDAVNRYREMVEDHEQAEERERQISLLAGESESTGVIRITRVKMEQQRALDDAAQAAWDQVKSEMGRRM